MHEVAIKAEVTSYSPKSLLAMKKQNDTIKTKQNKPQKKQIKYKTKQTPYIEAVSLVD